MEFLSRQRSKYALDNDELEYLEGIVVDEKPEDDVAVYFPGIQLESDDIGATGISATTDPLLEQDAYEAAENAGLSSPSKG